MATVIRSAAALGAAILLASCGDPSLLDSFGTEMGVVECHGYTKGYWANKNGLARVTADDLAYLASFRLVDERGAPVDLASGTMSVRLYRLRAFLRAANASNMANMLSAQWTAFALNHRHLAFCMGLDVTFLFPRFWGAGPGGVATFGQLESAVRDALAAGSAVTRAQMGLLKDFFDGANQGSQVCVCQPPTGATGATGASGR